MAKRNRKESGISAREQLLVGTLALSLVVAAYMVLRVPTLKRDAAVARENVERTEREIRKSRPSGSVGSTNRLRRDVEKLRDELEQERATLEGYRSAFVDLSDSDALPAMLGEITRQAELAGLQLVDRKNVTSRLETVLDLDRRLRQMLAPPPRATQSATASGNRRANRRANTAQSRARAAERTALQQALRRDEPLMNRPIFQFEFRGSFGALHRFITAIHSLQNSTVITQLSVGTDSALSVGGQRVLTANLTIAL
ncbi:MAG: hypothetical protein AAGA68_12660 [Pseudomonadota bacterium]